MFQGFVFGMIFGGDEFLPDVLKNKQELRQRLVKLGFGDKESIDQLVSESTLPEN